VAFFIDTFLEIKFPAMNTTEIALFSTSIGASAGILSQFVANALKNRSEKKKLKFDLIAEERRLTYMILLNQVSYVQSGITIEYYYQSALIHDETENGNLNLQKHYEEIKFSNSLHAEYGKLIGDYCKNIYQLIHYVGHAHELETIIEKIIDYPHDDFTGIFDGLKTYPELFEVYSKEHKLSSVILNSYKSYFHEIRQIIQKNTKNLVK